MKPQHLFLALLLVAIWGFNFVVIKIGLGNLPPFFLCSLRFIFAAVPAIFFVKRPAAPFKLVALYGCVLFALQFSLLFLGIDLGVPPGLASLLMQMQLLFTCLLGVYVFKEKIHWNQILGTFVSFGGIAMIAFHINQGLTLSGFLCLLCASFFWSLGSAISKKIGNVNMLSLVVWGSAVAAPLLLLASLLLEGPSKIYTACFDFSWQSCGSILYISYLSTLFSYAVWSRLVHIYPLNTTAPFTILIPFFALASSILILGEELQHWKIFAGLLILIGLGLSILPKRIESKLPTKTLDI